MAKNMKEASQRDAQDTLRQYWPRGVFPVDPVAIAIAMGLRVYSAQLGTDISGMIVREVDSDAEIWVDVDDSPTRQRFTVAHELGHYVERGGQAGAVNYVDRRGGPFTLRELYANEFAGNLLMPEEEVERMWKQTQSRVKLANYFGVSQDALGVRLRRLGLA